ncbi:uncharacterized protein LOC133185617 [Saccostrea echinata]|uniref:uncharacterized protein LOC133185617 n=1 Tax=Saccostrea echinata TaxID=191078 RepID=UPI002A81865C|nr:uncharacterized protein LOC133185617 [Saccostrea echinata]
MVLIFVSSERFDVALEMSIIAKRHFTAAKRRSSTAELLQNRRRSSVSELEDLRANHHRCAYHNRENAINESGESQEEDQTAELISSIMENPYDQLIRVIGKNSFPEIARSVQNFLDNQEPILNKQKLVLYLETIKTHSVPIIKEVMSAIRPSVLFPKHYKYKLMSESLKSGNPGVVDVVCGHLLPKSKLSKEDTVQIFKEALELNDLKILLSICVPLKMKRSIERDQAYRLLLMSIGTKNSAIVVQVLRGIRPKKVLTSQQKSYLLTSSIDTSNLGIVQIVLRLHDKIRQVEIENFLHKAVQSTPEIFLHLVHELKPVFNDSTLEDLLNSAYAASGNRDITRNIIQHFPPPSDIAKRFLEMFIRADDVVLIIVLLAHVSKLSAEEVQGIVVLSLRTGTNLFRYFSGIHDCPSEKISEIIEEQFEQSRRSCCSSNRCVNQTDDNSMWELIVHVLQSLQCSVSRIWEKLYQKFAQSGNTETLRLLNLSSTDNQENVVLHVLENLSRHPLKNEVIEVMLVPILKPTKTFLAHLEKLFNSGNFEEASIEVIQKYLLNFQHHSVHMVTEL